MAVRGRYFKGNVQEQKSNYQNIVGVKEREPGTVRGSQHVLSRVLLL